MEYEEWPTNTKTNENGTTVNVKGNINVNRRNEFY